MNKLLYDINNHLWVIFIWYPDHLRLNKLNMILNMSSMLYQHYERL
jgi:hypothetical protein